MDIRNAQFKALERTWVNFIYVVGVIGALYGLWSAWGAWGIAGMLGLLIVLLVLLLFGGGYAPVRFICDEDELKLELTKLLKNTKKSLHYYGGAGFIGDYQDWREQYEIMLQNKGIEIVRFLDLKSTAEMKEILKAGMEAEVVEKEIESYKTWLETHAERLEVRDELNCFYDFEGAPIWKYGLHCIVFDNKHVVFPHILPPDPNDKLQKPRHSAVIIRHCPGMATSITESTVYLQRVLKLEEKTKDDLIAMTKAR